MARAPRYPGQRSEYGGGDESPQRMPDGTAIPFEDHTDRKANALRARLLRTAGLHDYDPDPNSDAVGVAREVLIGGVPVSSLSAAQLEAYALDAGITDMLKADRAELQDKTNDYIDNMDAYSGEDRTGSYGEPTVPKEEG